MKFLHTADLHIGKTVHEISMIQDQKFILNQIVEIAVKEKVDALVVAGDIYDRPIPSTEAVNILDDFLARLSEKKITVFMISGNHDSPERVDFANRILEKQQLYIAGEEIKQVDIKDEYGTVTFVLLPFVKPALTMSKTSMESVEKLLRQISIDKKKNHRYVLITHYFVTGQKGEMPELSDSENPIQVGGLDNVEAALLKEFDYVALGHIHKPQKIGDRLVYYSGSPLKYSFSEVNQVKGVNLVTMEEEITVEKISLTALHEMRKIKGKLQELLRQDVIEAADQNDYIQAVLTDTEELIDPIGSLRSVYPNVMQILLQKNEEKDTSEYDMGRVKGRLSPYELFQDFYELVKGEAIDEKRAEIVKEAISQAESRER